jgi:hypothetical protein
VAKKHALDQSGFRRLAQAINRSEASPRGGSRRRRRNPILARHVLGGTGPCCDPYDCVDGDDVTGVYSCAVCEVVATAWHIIVPGGAFGVCCPDMVGAHDLVHFSGCIWKSADFVCNGTITRWILTLDPDVSTLVCDLGPLGIICFEKRGPWCCTCANAMVACCGPHPDCTQGDAPPFYLCVHPGPGTPAEPPGNVVCGDTTYPGTFQASSGGGTGDVVYQPGSGVWFGKVDTGAICESGRIYVYVTIECVGGELVASGSSESNTASDMCQVTGSGTLSGSEPNWGSVVLTVGPDCCLSEGSTVTIDFTGTLA